MSVVGGLAASPLLLSLFPSHLQRPAQHVGLLDLQHHTPIFDQQHHVATLNEHHPRDSSTSPCAKMRRYLGEGHMEVRTALLITVVASMGTPNMSWAWGANGHEWIAASPSRSCRTAYRPSCGPPEVAA